MYFWRIELLKAQLRHGLLDQQLSFKYLVATFLMYPAFSELPGWRSAEVDYADVASWVAYVVYLLVIVAGTYWTFVANGGRLGIDFAARYLAIGWVVGIRLLAVFFLVMGVIVVILPIGFGAGLIGEPPDAAWEWAGALAWLGFEALLYGRLAHHMRDVARPQLAVDG